jgi:hypothetical protein
VPPFSKKIRQNPGAFDRQTELNVTTFFLAVSVLNALQLAPKLDIILNHFCWIHKVINSSS